MYCGKCGELNSDSARFCTVCGSKLEKAETAPVHTPVQQPAEPAWNPQGYTQPAPGWTNQGTMSYLNFYENYASKNTKTWVKAMYIICFVSAALGILTLLLYGPLSLIDIAFYSVMGFLLMKKKTVLFALIPTCYSGVFSVINLAMGGSVSGVFALICGISASVNLIKLDKAYKAYLQTGVLPAAFI